MKTKYKYTFITQYGEEPLEKYKTLKQKLKMLQTNKEGFVTLVVEKEGKRTKLYYQFLEMEKWK